MKAFIGIGKSSKYIFYILFIFICKLLCDLLMGFNNKEKRIKFFNFTPNLKSHNLIKDLITYLSSFLCGLLFYLFKNKLEMLKKGELSFRKHEKFKRKFFGEKSESINLILFLISFIYSLNSIIRSFLYSIISYGELWMLEIAFIVILSKLILKIKIGNHQKVTVFVVSGILLIIYLINCLLPRTRHTNCDNNNECKDIYLSDNNLFIFISKLFGSYYFIPLIIIIYIILDIMRDYSWVKTKYLIDIKTIPYYKIFFFLGMIGSIIVSISLAFSSFIPCQTLHNISEYYNETTHTNTYYDNNDIINFSTKLCNLKIYNKDKNELYLYYDNIFIYFDKTKELNKENLIEIFLIIPLYFILKALLHFSIIMIIRYFDPNMLLVSFNFYYFTKRLIEFIVNEGNEIYLTHIQFYLHQAEELISIIANLIYMEIIELRFCKLDHDIKRNIYLRGSLEYVDNIFEEDEDEDEDEDKDEEENHLNKLDTFNISLSEL